jgi:anti-anti-sigma factor
MSPLSSARGDIMSSTLNPLVDVADPRPGRPHLTLVGEALPSQLGTHTDCGSMLIRPGRADSNQMASTVVLGGEHDAGTIAELSTTLARSISTGNDDLIVDLSRVQFMAAATVGVLVRARMLLGIRSRSLRLRSPSQRARRILELSNLADLIDQADAAR